MRKPPLPPLRPLARVLSLGCGLIFALSCGGNGKQSSTPDPLNQPPSLADATFNNAGTTFNSARNLNLLTLTGASDPEGGAVSFRVNRTLAGADIGTLTVSGNSATFVPNPGIEGKAVFEVVAVDQSGLLSVPRRLTVDLVDTLAPALEGPTYDTVAVTSHDVTVTIHSADGDPLAAPAGWTRLGASGNWTFTRTYADNITADPFTVQDLAGNASTVKVTIGNIDKTGPVVDDATYDAPVASNQDVTATLCSRENLAAPAGWTKSFAGSSWKYAFSKTFSANASETVSFQDAAGNSTSKVVAITWIDKTAPAVVTFEAANATDTSLDLHVLVDETGKGYLWFPAIVPGTEPSAAEVVTHATSDASTLTLTRDTLAVIHKTALTASANYVAYLVSEDPLGNRSGVAKLALRTQPSADTPPSVLAPTFTALTPTGLTVVNAISDPDGVRNLSYDLYGDASGSHLVGSNTTGQFTGLTASTPYWARTSAETRNGSTQAWTAQVSPLAATATPAVTFPITVAPTIHGSVTPSGIVPVVQGASQDFSIAPAPNYHVSTVTLDAFDLGAVVTLTVANVQAAHAIVATFAINTYTLTYGTGPNGGVTGSLAQTVNATASGSPVTAVPNPNYHFVNWSDGSTMNPRTDSNVLANHAVTANFAMDTFTLTYAAGSNGTLSGAAAQTVNAGANGAAVTAVANPSYHFVNWSDGGTANPRVDSNVLANVAVTANFAINTYTLSYLSGPNGSISYSGYSG